MLFERSATKRVHFSAPERPFRSRPGDVALIFFFSFPFLLYQDKRKGKTVRMAKTITSRVYIIYKVYLKTHCKVTMKKVTHVKPCIKAR